MHIADENSVQYQHTVYSLPNSSMCFSRKFNSIPAKAGDVEALARNEFGII